MNTIHNKLSALDNMLPQQLNGRGNWKSLSLNQADGSKQTCISKQASGSKRIVLMEMRRGIHCKGHAARITEGVWWSHHHHILLLQLIVVRLKKGIWWHHRHVLLLLSHGCHLNWWRSRYVVRYRKWILHLKWIRSCNSISWLALSVCRFII